MQGQYLCQCLDIWHHDLFHAVEPGKMNQAVEILLACRQRYEPFECIDCYISVILVSVLETVDYYFCIIYWKKLTRSKN